MTTGKYPDCLIELRGISLNISREAPSHFWCGIVIRIMTYVYFSLPLSLPLIFFIDNNFLTQNFGRELGFFVNFDIRADKYPASIRKISTLFVNNPKSNDIISHSNATMAKKGFF